MSRRLPGRALGAAALVAFVLLDAVLVGLALRSTAGAGDTAVAAPAAGTTGAGAGAAVDTGTPAAAGERTGPAGDGPGTGAAPLATPLAAGLVVVDSARAWRFTAGDCTDGGASLAVTDDGGQTWQPRPAPFDTLVRVRVRDNGTIFAVGADADCRPRFRQSAGDGSDWSRATPVPRAWYRHPGDPLTLGTVTGEETQPCGAAAVVDLAVSGDAAQVLCADGRLLASDTGRAWTLSAEVDGALALAVVGARALVAAVRPGCDGVAVLDAVAAAPVLGCASVPAVEEGSVALGGHGEDLWLLAGDAVLRSTGDLADWVAAG